ncbi:hypothetical protein RIF29_08436 [Crotalaria pallida]|uniref:Uncharacterized protein n=1 Tax=Crotalaria pallida TaxID=3830 RepID=A0AAN9IJ81_CROPI
MSLSHPWFLSLPPHRQAATAELAPLSPSLRAAATRVLSPFSREPRLPPSQERTAAAVGSRCRLLPPQNRDVGCKSQATACPLSSPRFASDAPGPRGPCSCSSATR